MIRMKEGDSIDRDYLQEFHKYTKNPLNVGLFFCPEIAGDSSSDLPEEFEINSFSEKVLNRLTNLVRKQYITYLEKILRDNYENWDKNKNVNTGQTKISGEFIRNCALSYELKAVKSCMVVQIYRKSMLKIMSNIRHATMQGRLIRNFKNNNYPEKLSEGDLKENSTQTEYAYILNENGQIENKFEYDNPTLKEKIENFQQLFKQEESHQFNNKSEESVGMHNAKYLRKKRPHSLSESLVHDNKLPKLSDNFTDENVNSYNVTLCNKPTVEDIKREEDEIAKELDLLFAEESDEIDNIFGEVNTIDPQIDLILKEIEQSKTSQIGNYSTSVTDQMITKPGTYENNFVENKFQRQQQKNQNELTDSTLYDSLWPCEYHMRMQRLSLILQNVADQGMRYHENLKKKFFELFGDDSDDEFAPYSPNLEDNEILLASCKKRIAPWIVKHLMKPLKEGLIGDRFLFKKLAKRLAHCIVLDNQYPDEEYIKSAVLDFFCFRQKVTCPEDIERG